MNHKKEICSKDKVSLEEESQHASLAGFPVLLETVTGMWRALIVQSSSLFSVMKNWNYRLI